MKVNLNLIVGMILTLMVFILIICIGLLTLDKMNVDMNKYYKKTCGEMDGELVTYTGCNCDPIFMDCSECKLAGTYCKLSNGTEIDITIRDAVV